jgi:N-acyl-D-amino-acid deacylase
MRATLVPAPRARTEKRRALCAFAGLATAIAALSLGCNAPAPQPPSETTVPASAPVASAAPSAGETAATGASSAPASSAAPRAALPEKPFRSDEVFDVVLRGGDVIDGRGTKRRRADVLIRGDEIEHVGIVDASVKAKLVLDATGAVVTPGFVDVHSHGDAAASARNLVAQGVTTIVVGQDGRSPGTGGPIRDWVRRVREQRPVINVATLIGHASIRVQANVGARTNPSTADLARMAALVERGMDDGALGLSTGLEYDPGRMASAAELTAIARPVAARAGIVMSHLRTEDEGAITGAIDELLAQAASSGAHVHVSHVKIVGGRGTAPADALLKQLARGRGVASVTADWYPYTASYTGLEILFPDFARPPNDYDSAKRTRLPALREHLRKRVLSRNGPEATLFGTGPFAGKTLAAAAKERGIPFEDVLVDLGPRGASAAYFVMDEALQSRLFLDENVMVGSDGGGGGGHPRGAGSFARVIEEMVGKRGLMTLEEAVSRMTWLPQDRVFDSNDRGNVRVGQIADLAVFVPSEVHETATFTQPNRTATGMRHVLVAGEPVLVNGREKPGARPGRVLLGRTAKD